MTDARAFCALRYDPRRVELSKVIVPPYDVIAADEREGYYRRDPHNAIRFELTRDVKDEADADYAEIAGLLSAWRESGVLIRDGVPGFYVMKQRFEAPGGTPLERIGFYAELGLAEYEEGIVRPHERTLAGPKADRLKLLRAARANLSTVFLLYEDRAGKMADLLVAAFDAERGGEVLGQARDDAGVEYTLARITDSEACLALASFMSERPTVIADGHHRYETALNYRREMREAHGIVPGAPYESTLAYFANAYAPGSLLLPIHRVVKTVPAPDLEAWQARLGADWRVEVIELAAGEAIGELLDRRLAPLAGRAAFMADAGDGRFLLFVREEPLGDELMVRLIERDVLGAVFDLGADAIRDGAVSFPKSAERAFRAVREGEGTVALYLNPLSPDDVFRVTGAGEVMPQKSTFFYPKVPTGLVFRVHEPAP